MAWRIHDSVIRGEIDNRERGRVTGRVWLDGIKEAVVLELQGNAAADLAGCLLTFENPGKTVPMRTDATFNPLQRGSAGDITASRKVRVPDVPIEEFIALRKQGKPAPEHWANSLYLEWYSDYNGRVVIESADYRLTVSQPSWRLSPDDEQQRQQQSSDGFSGFIDKLSKAVEEARHEPPEEKEWDEFDYEKFMQESDARTDKYMELMDKYMDHPDSEEIIAREMGWALDGNDAGDEEFEGSEEFASGDAETTEEEAQEVFRVEEGEELPPPQPDPLTEGVDWVRDEDGDISHPLSLRAFDSSMELWHQCKDLGLGKGDDADLCALISEFQITSAKLAGALDGLAYGRHYEDGAFIVACLKRALKHLHTALSALERVVPKKLLSEDVTNTTRGEMFAIREEILNLMKEFRGKP